jgi:glutathione S-transferase
VLDTLERAVSQGPYLAGDTFTAADLYVGSQLGFGLQFGMIEKRSAFVEYVGRLSARPAAVRAKQIDDALTPQQQS